jgi:hypothetical protein
MRDEDFLLEEKRDEWQKHLALLEASEMNYQDDSDATGYVQPIDVEAETVQPIDCSCDNGLYESLTGDWAVCQKCRPSRVGPTPTSPEAETTPWNHQTLEDEAMAAMLAAEKQTLLDCLSTIEQVFNKQSPDVGAALDGCYQIYKHLRGL